MKELVTLTLIEYWEDDHITQKPDRNMLIVKEDKTRNPEHGQIFVELTENRGLSVSECNRLGYWCDKAHLRHFILEAGRVMSDADLIDLLGKRLKI
jgi:hypothetical protein